MRHLTLGLLIAAGAVLLSAPREAAAGDLYAQWRAARMSWHGQYYHTSYGAPVALVLPPTVKMQTAYSWGVAQTTRTPIWPQFKRAYASPDGGSRQLYPTPLWPSHTDQFGVYYVRAPWGQKR